MPQTKVCDSYIIDTYHQVDTGKYCPGAIMYSGRRKLETRQWKEQAFDTQREADDFVREHLAALNIHEARNEGELRSAT